jgi:hypothetical protein
LPPARLGSLSGPASGSNADFMNKISELEAELREISSELAGSIRREMELEDLVERFQLESHNDANRRTSDYFSDSGMSGSIRTGTDGGKVEDIERIKRAAEQERAQLKVELSQKWQEERSRRAACESHVQILENQVQQVPTLFLFHYHHTHRFTVPCSTRRQFQSLLQNQRVGSCIGRHSTKTPRGKTAER